MRKVIYLPHYGEFGFLIMNHLRAVHEDEADAKIVCCERGYECLFPSATGFFHDYPTLKDEHRGGDSSDWKWQECEDSDRRLRDLLPQKYPGYEVVKLNYDSPWRLSGSSKSTPRAAAELPKVDVALGVRKPPSAPRRTGGIGMILPDRSNRSGSPLGSWVAGEAATTSGLTHGPGITRRAPLRAASTS